MPPTEADQTQLLSSMLKEKQKVIEQIDRTDMDLLAENAILHRTVLNQRIQLRQLHDTIWRRKQATRKLRERLEELTKLGHNSEEDLYNSGKRAGEAKRD